MSKNKFEVPDYGENEEDFGIIGAIFGDAAMIILNEAVSRTAEREKSGKAPGPLAREKHAIIRADATRSTINTINTARNNK